MKRILAALLGIALCAGAAHSQIPGSFDAGTVFGNSSAAKRPGRVETVPNIFDRALCATQGGIVTRNSTTWVCLTPGTAGLPLLSGGAGANLAYGALSLSTGISGFGTGVATALGVNVGSAGAPVLFNGALGTPSSGTLTNATGLPIAGLANIAANTVLSNWTAGSAAVSANTWPSCAADGTHALTYTNGTGVLCTSITAGTIGGSTGATDNAALRADGTSGATIQASPLIIADTTGSLSRSGNGGIPLQGTNTNDDAASGFLGEYVETEVLVGSAVALTTGVAANVTGSFQITAGDWNVCGQITYNPAGTTVPGLVVGWVSTTSATQPTIPNKGAISALNASFATGQTIALPTGCRRYSVTTTTTVFLSTVTAFTTSTMSAYGIIWGRRLR